MKARPSPRAEDGAAAVTALIVEIFRLNGRLLAAGDALVGDLGLSSARWQVLGALAAAPLPVAHAARNMGLTRQAVQRLANALAAEGLLRFDPNPHHRRAQLVSLTTAGRAAYLQAMQLQAPWARALASGVKASEIRQAHSLLERLRQQLESGSAAPARKDARDDP